MLQYLLNASAIWLISLVLFDAFLRKESYHSYNRFYLLFTFLLGALLPMWQWPDNSIITGNALQKPLERVINAKQSIVDGSAQQTAIGWQQWLTIIYLAGIVVMFFFLLIDIIKLAAYYQVGKSTQAGTWRIIETGKEHAPFSFLHTLFVSSRQQYSNEEWHMILNHEQRHTTLFHFADLLLMQLARLLFWFHPLVYVYNRRLLLVHEYQADNASATQPQQYGQFLLQQAMLGAAPVISHSFNRSPIKNRIIMLTRRSSAVSKSKMLLFIPLALVCVVCFSKNSFSQKFEKKGNMVTYRGNKFELSKPLTDTMILIDPVTGKEIYKYVTRDPAPIKMNGNKIYNSDDFSNTTPRLGEPVSLKAGLDDKSLREYVLSNLKDEFKSLPDMQYRIDVHNVVIGEAGNIVYFENGGISSYKETNKMGDPVDIKISTAVQDKFTKKIQELLHNAPSHTPAVINGDKKVPYMLNSVAFWNPFTIKDHKLTAE